MTGVCSLPPPPSLADVDGLALFLDLDGTLAPFAARPGDVVPDDGRNGILVRLRQRLHGRLAVVSGRSMGEVDRILGGSVAAVSGSHGLERRSANGNCLAFPAHPGLEQARAAFAALARSEPALLLEEKSASIALHYRSAPSLAGAIRAQAQRLAEETGLALQEGVLVVELRTPGPDKGDAIRAFLAEPPFVGARPIFVGDDLTDEHGFAVVEEMGGIAVLVGTRRPTQARHGLADTPAVLRWLKGDEI